MIKQKIVKFIKDRYIRLVIWVVFIILGFVAALIMTSENIPFSETWIIIPFICAPSAYHFFCPKSLSIRRLLSIISGYTMLASGFVFVLTVFVSHSSTEDSFNAFHILSIVLFAISVILFYTFYYAVRNDKLETKITNTKVPKFKNNNSYIEYNSNDNSQQNHAFDIINAKYNTTKTKKTNKIKQKALDIIHSKVFKLIIIGILVISIITVSITQCNSKDTSSHAESQTTISTKSSGGSHDSNFVTPEKYPSRIVYVSKYKLIHSNTSCSNLKYYTTMKLEQAEKSYKYCSKCW